MANETGEDESHIRAELERILYDLRDIASSIDAASKIAQSFPHNHPDVYDFFNDTADDLENAFHRATDALKRSSRVVGFAKRFEHGVEPLEKKGSPLSKRHARNVEEHEKQVIKRGIFFAKKLESFKNEIERAYNFAEYATKYFKPIGKRDDVTNLSLAWRKQLITYLGTLHTRLLDEIEILKYLYGMQNRVGVEAKQVEEEVRRAEAFDIRELRFSQDFVEETEGLARLEIKDRNVRITEFLKICIDLLPRVVIQAAGVLSKRLGRHVNPKDIFESIKKILEHKGIYFVGYYGGYRSRWGKFDDIVDRLDTDTLGRIAVEAFDKIIGEDPDEAYNFVNTKIKKVDEQAGIRGYHTMDYPQFMFLLNYLQDAKSPTTEEEKIGYSLIANAICEMYKNMIGNRSHIRVRGRLGWW